MLRATAAWVLLASLAMVQTPASAVNIRVDPRIAYQVMEGFGTSSRVWEDPHLADAPSSVVPPAAQEEILGLLYRDLGLTRVRPILDAGIEPVNDNPDPATFDWSRFRFDGKRNDAHVAFVRQARGYGLRVYFPAPLMAEPWMTEEAPEEYAEWLMAVLLRWRALGLEPPYVSVINEPGHRRSGLWTAGWLRGVVRSLGPRLRAAGLGTLLVIPDDLNPTQAYGRAAAVLDDPAARPYVGALAFHLYGGSAADLVKLRALSARYGVPLWMTEFTDGRYSEYAGALQWATLVHRLISDDGVSAVDYIWGFFGDQGRRRARALVALQFRQGQYQARLLTPMYYLMGQFSRFVRPGYTRVAASSPDHAVLVTAYRGAGDLVLVAINTGATPRPLDVTLADPAPFPSFRVVRTSRTERWVVPEPVLVRGGRLFTVLPGESVTTLIGSRP